MGRPRLIPNRRAFNAQLDQTQIDWLGRESCRRGLSPSAYLRQLIDEKRAVQTQPKTEKIATEYTNGGQW